MTMYLVVPQLKNRQMEIERGCFFPLAVDDRRLLDVVTLIKARYFGADPPAQ